MIRPCRSLALFSIVFALGSLLSVAPAPAEASPATLRRSLTNIVNAPLDMLLSPLSGGYALANNMNDMDDTKAVRVVYPLPGWVWLSGLNLGSGAIRAVTGALELLPGIVLFPFQEQDLAPLFDAVENASGIIQFDNPLAGSEHPWISNEFLLVPFTIGIKGGINYSRVEN